MSLRDELVKEVKHYLATAPSEYSALHSVTDLAEEISDGVVSLLTDKADEWIEAEAQISTSPGPRHLPYWSRMHKLQLLNLLAALTEDSGEVHPSDEKGTK